MDWTPFLFLLGLVVLALIIPPRWDPAIRIKEWQIRRGFHPEARPPGHPERWRDFLTQAREDQAKTDYPGCCRGIMFCRSTVCGCINESKPNDCFVRARAKALARKADGPQEPQPVPGVYETMRERFDRESG